MTPSPRVLTTLISAGALASAIAMSTPASASPTGSHGRGVSVNPYSPQANGHAYRHGAYGTAKTNASMRAWARAHAGSAAASSATGTQTLSYGGGVDGIGVASGKPKVYLVFWGSQWGSQGTDASGNLTFSGDSYGGAPKLQNMFKGLGTGGEQWSGVMTQYCDGAGVTTGATSCPTTAAHVGYPTGGAYAGVWYDNSAASPSASTGNQIATEAVKAAGHFGNTTAASNRYAQYVILSPKGVNPDNYKTGGFCAWHDWNGDTTLSGGAATSNYGDVAFTNMPYVMDQGSGCGMNFVNSGTAGQTDGYTMVEGHEYAETLTDQNPAGGWTNSTGSTYNGQENADECAWISPGSAGGAGNVAMGNGSYAEQATWSNDTNSCALAHPTVGGSSTSANTVSVTSPGNQSTTAGSSASVAIKATDSSSTATLTYSASGLPAGLTINASTGVISGTPTTAGSYSVKVTATDNTGAAGSASFTWTVTSPTGGSSCSGQKITNPGFESGTTGWTGTSGVIAQNGTSQPAHTGTWDAWMDGYGSAHTDSVSQTVTIPAGCKATLNYYVHIDTAETTTTSAYDKMTLTAGSTTLQTLSNLNAGTGYQLKTIDLSAYAGQTITLKWTGTEDSSLQTSFVLDDITLNLS